MTQQDRVMLLIDADNVSVDVMEQAVQLLLQEHGGLHVRRAYCTAESAVKHQAVFKRLSIKPMVNLAAGKNSTDIALAVDAMDLVLAERPDVVAIASSDSDFAPLVARLREKGCRVVGLGQDGKTGDETLAAYDSFTVLEHRKARSPAKRVTARKAVATTPARPAPPAAPKSRARSRPEVDIDLDDDRDDDRDAGQDDGAREAGDDDGGTAPVVKRAPRARAGARVGRAAKTADKTAAAASPGPAPAPRQAAAAPASASRATPAMRPPKVQQILDCLPELENGKTLELRVASQRLREARLLSNRGSSPKLFGPFAEHFELLPPKAPNHVRLLPLRD